MPYSDRQAQILALAAKGLSDKEIAKVLDLSTHTVRTYLKRLYHDQQLSNRAEAVAAFVTEQHEQQATREETAGSDVGGGGAADPGSFQRPVQGEAGQPALPRRPKTALVVALLLVLGATAVMARGGPSLSGQLASLGQERSAAIGPAVAATAAGSPAPSQSGASSRPTLAPTSGETPRAGPAVKTQLGSRLQALINKDRVSGGLPALTWNDCLAAVALLNAQRMATQEYVSPANGISLDGNCHLGSGKPAEILAYWSTVNDAAANSVFMANPVQRANIMGPFRYVGTAWAVSPTGIAFIAVELS
jgi:uncharacterized protein YkwD/DNA-binding CsgD family transcriptional regulator